MYKVVTTFDDETQNYFETDDYDAAFEFLEEDRLRHLSFKHGVIKKGNKIVYQFRDHF